MAAYDLLVNLVQEYFIDLGYNNNYIKEYFSPNIFKELVAIRLANANVMIRNKTDRSSHQTHIAITGEAIDFFYDNNVFSAMDNKVVQNRVVYVSPLNIKNLRNLSVEVKDAFSIEKEVGNVTIGKRTQKQVQLSKRNSMNSDNFNQLRLGLYENDLLIMFKYRDSEDLMAIGIPQVYYLDYIPNYASKYETNTYLRMPKRQ